MQLNTQQKDKRIRITSAAIGLIIIADQEKNKSNETIDIQGLSRCRFIYGPVMQKKWVEIKTILLNFIAAKFGQIVRSSFTAGKVIVTEVDDSILPKFKTKEEKEDHLGNLEFWE